MVLFTASWGHDTENCLIDSNARNQWNNHKDILVHCVQATRPLVLVYSALSSVTTGMRQAKHPIYNLFNADDEMGRENIHKVCFFWQFSCWPRLILRYQSAGKNTHLTIALIRVTRLPSFIRTWLDETLKRLTIWEPLSVRLSTF